MIDNTSSRIEQQASALRRANRRRYAFQRMLQATDRMLWLLEEMNRDGVKTVPRRVRAELRGVVAAKPNQIREPLRVTGHAQVTLDSLSAVQERLARTRYPDWDAAAPDGGEYALDAREA